jgi:hypothetical protein
LVSGIRWCNWRFEWLDGKWKKVPYFFGQGRGIKFFPLAVTKIQNLTEFQRAYCGWLNRHRDRIDGIGWVFVGADGYIGIDLDGCLDPEGRLRTWAESIVESLRGAYSEISPSGLGLKFWMRGTLPARGFKKSWSGQDGERCGVEIYDDGRYFTVTGRAYWPVPATIPDLGGAALAIYREYLTDGEGSRGKSQPERAVRPETGANGTVPHTTTLTDDELIEKAAGSANGPEFSALYHSGDRSGHGQDDSRADFHLACKLVFWAGPDPHRVDRLFRRSALMRDKWDTPRPGGTYGSETIRAALKKVTTYYEPGYRPNGSASGGIGTGGGGVGGNRSPSGREVVGTRAPRSRAGTGGVPQLPSFTNFDEVEIEGGAEDNEHKTVKVPMSISEIGRFLDTLMPGRIRRERDRLFVETADHRPIYLDRPAQLMSVIAESAPIDLIHRGSYVTQDQFFEYMRRHAPECDAIENNPHWPPMRGVCYMHPPLPRPSGKLDGLVSYFSPATERDRDLIVALILTAFWGGAPGRRPAFLITGESGDLEMGRGIGKTTLIDVISGGLAGGSVDVSPGDEIDTVKTRVLSDLARQIRFVRLDNVKSLRFSWADLESLITAPEVSGRMLYRGEGRRPNTLIWTITLNGGNLSKDMAQRVITIKLKRPTCNVDWLDGVQDFARDHRWEIIADAIDLLSREPRKVVAKTRWGDWERSVLAHCTTDLEACQRVILDRQGEVDSDDEERDLVREYFAKQLGFYNHNPDSCYVLIPSRTVASWLGLHNNATYAPNVASGHLKKLGIVELKPFH